MFGSVGSTQLVEDYPWWFSSEEIPFALSTAFWPILQRPPKRAGAMRKFNEKVHLNDLSIMQINMNMLAIVSCRGKGSTPNAGFRDYRLGDCVWTTHKTCGAFVLAIRGWKNQLQTPSSWSGMPHEKPISQRKVICETSIATSYGPALPEDNPSFALQRADDKNATWPARWCTRSLCP